MRASCGGMRSILPCLTLMRKVPTIPRLPRAMVPHVVFILGCSARCFEGRVGKHWPHEGSLGFVAERRVGRHGRVWPHGRTRFRFRSPTERVVGPLRHHRQRMLINVLSRKVMMRSPNQAVIACSLLLQLPALPPSSFRVSSSLPQPFPASVRKGALQPFSTLRGSRRYSTWRMEKKKPRIRRAQARLLNTFLQYAIELLGKLLKPTFYMKGFTCFTRFDVPAAPMQWLHRLLHLCVW